MAIEKIAVLCGGNSAERAISLLSGHAIQSALCQSGVHAELVDPHHSPLIDLVKEGYQKVFIALHGRGGEDGSLQGLIEHLGLPYTGSGVIASALALDKWRSKLVWQALGLPVVPYQLVTPDYDPQLLTELIDRFGFPLAVKPVDEGSSIGISKVDSEQTFPAALVAAFHCSDRVLVEPWLCGEEYTVAILEDQALPSICIRPMQNFYDYHAKYCSDQTHYFCPSGLSQQQEQILGKLALAAYQALGCRGWGRIDFVTDNQGKFYLLEANTVPGMTSHSLVPMAAKQIGLTFPQLVVKILALAG